MHISCCGSGTGSEGKFPNGTQQKIPFRGFNSSLQVADQSQRVRRALGVGAKFADHKMKMKKIILEILDLDTACYL